MAYSWLCKRNHNFVELLLPVSKNTKKETNDCSIIKREFKGPFPLYCNSLHRICMHPSHGKKGQPRSRLAGSREE